MTTKVKDRIINFLLILIFILIISASAYGILKVITKWNIKELG